MVLIALLLRYPRLWDFGLRQDAFHHYETAIGYLRTGRFVQWDFLRDTAGRPYSRAWMYTAQIAWVFRRLGVSYGNARLVSLFWGVLLFLPVACVCRALSMKRWETLLVVFWIAISPHFITTSRWIRMYSMFTTSFLAALVCAYYVLRGRRRVRTVLAWGMMIAFGLLAVHVHLMAALMVPAVVGFSVSEWLGDGRRRSRFHARRLGGFLLGVLVVAGVMAVGFERPMLYWGSGGVGSEVGTARIYPGYLIYLVEDSVEYALGGLMLALVLLGCRETPAERFFLWSLCIPSLLIVVFITRYPMYRYMSPMIPLAMALFARVPRKLSRCLGSGTGRRVGAVLLAAMVLVPVSNLRGELSYIWSGNMGYVHFMGVETGRMDPVIRHVRPRLREGDYVGLFYWKHSTYYLAKLDRPGVRVERYPREGSFLTVENLRRLEASHRRVWILYPEWMLRNLLPETERYLQRTYRRVLPGKRYHMNVFVKFSDSREDGVAQRKNR